MDLCQKLYNKLKFICNHFLKFIAIIFILFCLLVLVDVFSSLNPIMKYFDLGSKLHDPAKFHAGVISILTIALIVIAWVQLNISNKTSKEQFLLELDGRYTSKECAEARQIIHRIYRGFGGDNIPRSYKINQTAQEIEKIRLSDVPSDIKDFIYLHNFIDILETIALFYNRGSVSYKDLKILSGDSLIFYHKIFANFIINRRINSNNNSYYSELEKCVQSLQDRL